jgi:hypothetical protein
VECRHTPILGAASPERGAARSEAAGSARLNGQSPVRPTPAAWIQPILQDDSVSEPLRPRSSADDDAARRLRRGGQGEWPRARRERAEEASFPGSRARRERLTERLESRRTLGHPASSQPRHAARRSAPHRHSTCQASDQPPHRRHARDPSFRQSHVHERQLEPFLRATEEVVEERDISGRVLHVRVGFANSSAALRSVELARFGVRVMVEGRCLLWSFVYLGVRNLFALVWLLGRPRRSKELEIYRRRCFAGIGG